MAWRRTGPAPKNRPCAASRSSCQLVKLTNNDRMISMRAMDSRVLSHNLRRLREAKNLTQAELAEQAGISRVAYGSIESGASSPRVETLLRIAAALGVRMQELLEPARILRAVRFRALKKMTTREQILTDVGRWLENYSELEQMVDKRVSYKLDGVPKAIGSKAGADRARAAAVTARTALRLKEGETIRDICGLIEERAGVKVYPMRVASDAFFGLSVGKEDGGPAIVVNTWDRISVERWIFTAAHELGHLLLHLGAYDVEKSGESDGEEKEADQFASHFLMPDEVFRQEWEEASGHGLVDRVFKVKRIFRVSYRSVLYRLAQSEEYGPKIWGLFQYAYKQRHGVSLMKADEPDAVPPEAFQAASARAADEPKRLEDDDFVEDRLSKLVRIAFDKQLISVSRAAEILEVDLKEMRERISSWVA